MTDDKPLIRNVTWAELAVILATGHPPAHSDCPACDARMYQVVTRVQWAVNVHGWFEGWNGFWNLAYETLQLAKPVKCGCQFNVACDALMLQVRARNRDPEEDPAELIRGQIDDMFAKYLMGHVCPKAPIQLELF